MIPSILMMKMTARI